MMTTGAKQIVATSGCFFLFRRGHMEALAFAALTAQRRNIPMLHIGINTDNYLQKKKPGIKIESATKRAFVVQNFMDYLYPAQVIIHDNVSELLRPLCQVFTWVVGADHLTNLFKERMFADELVFTPRDLTRSTSAKLKEYLN